MDGWRPGASRRAVEARAQLLSTIRQFFAERDVLEVETPLLSRSGNNDPGVQSLSIDSRRKRYLRTSPEYAMKRMLASGHQHIYELGRVFRKGESGRFHNPEFTLLEWYRTGMDYHDLSSEVVQLIQCCAAGQFDDWPVAQHSYRQLFTEHTGLDPFFCTESDLSDCAFERGIHSGPLGQQEWLDLILAEVIQPALPGEGITIVYDYPAEQAALARIRPDDPPVAERFEVYLGQMELANGYQELTDAEEQLKRFEQESRSRESRGEDAAPIDLNLVAAMRCGLADCSGVALGVDRLLMSLLKLERMDAVLAFSTDRA
jgi:lysyl-tRNA synthetase class 2